MDQIANAITQLMTTVSTSSAFLVKGAKDISTEWVEAYKDRTKADRERTTLLTKLTDGGTTIPVVIAQVDTSKGA